MSQIFGGTVFTWSACSAIDALPICKTQTNLQTKFILGRKCFGLDHLSNEPQMREFIAPLCVKTHSYAIALLSSASRYCIGTVDINGHVIVLKQHF